MENLKELEHLCRIKNFALEIYYSRIVDWCVNIFLADKTSIVRVEHCDINYALAKAHVELKDWLLENRGGY